MQPLSSHVQRSASARFTDIHPTRYYGADPTPQGPAYTAYEDAGLSTRPPRTPWSPAQSQFSGGSWQDAATDEWQRSRFPEYQPRRSVDRPEPSNRQHLTPPRHSVSSAGTHDEQMDHLSHRTRLVRIEEGQQVMNQRLAEQQIWNAQAGEAIHNIQQNQEANIRHWEAFWDIPAYHPYRSPPEK